MLRRVALVRTDVSEEPGASFIRVTRIGELGTTQVATSNRRTLRKNTKSVLTRATRRNIPKDTILHPQFMFLSYCQRPCRDNVTLPNWSYAHIWRDMNGESHYTEQESGYARRDTAVGVATGYGQDARAATGQVPLGPRIFTSTRCPDWLSGPPGLLQNGHWNIASGE
jgi:hypothetical protein